MTRFHHVGIQTDDLENCLNWYLEFFEAKQTWQLTRFSELTLSRLPDIVELTEVTLGDVRFHLFNRNAHDRQGPAPDCYQFQHVCLAVDTTEELHEFRRRWLDIYNSGKYVFARADQPTEIVTDDDGIQSLYILDVNGLEFEFTYVPDSAHV